MITRRLFLFATAVLLVWSQVALAVRADEGAEGAAKFIKDFGNRSISQLTAEGLSDRVLRDRFRSLFEEGFDATAIGKFVLARHWRRATAGERTEFLSLFKDFIVHTYASRFREYSGETFDVTAVRSEADNIFIVESEVITPEGGPPIHLDWRVEPHENVYKIYDITVEGMSMAVTHRSEFASVIKRGGGRVDALISALRDKMKELGKQDEAAAR